MAKEAREEAREEAKKKSRSAQAGSGVCHKKEVTASTDIARESLPTPSRCDAKVVGTSESIRESVSSTCSEMLPEESRLKPVLQQPEREADVAAAEPDNAGNRFPVAPPAGAMCEIEEIDGEEREQWKNAAGENIWLVETYDFGEDRSRPIESADGRCFAGKLMWRTASEIEDEFRRRWAG
jgi:hypothetical protein